MIGVERCEAAGGGEIVGVGGEVGGDVVDEVVVGGDVALDEREQRGFVFLVSDDDGHFGESAGLHGDFGALGEEVVARVGAREVGEVEGSVAEDSGHGCDGADEIVVGQCAETGKGIGVSGTGGRTDDLVVNVLGFGRTDVGSRYETSGVHDGSAEELAAIVVNVSPFEYRVIGDRDGSGTFAPDGHFRRIASKCRDVLLFVGSAKKKGELNAIIFGKRLPYLNPFQA